MSSYVSFPSATRSRHTDVPSSAEPPPPPCLFCSTPLSSLQQSRVLAEPAKDQGDVDRPARVCRRDGHEHGRRLGPRHRLQAQEVAKVRPFRAIFSYRTRTLAETDLDVLLCVCTLFRRAFAMAAAGFMNSNSLPIALMQSLVVEVPGLKVRRRLTLSLRSAMFLPLMLV